MKKNIILKDAKLLDGFLAIFSIGLTHCLEKDLMPPLRAENRLFSPVLAYSLNEEMVSEETIKAFDFASEVEACYGASYYEKSVVEARNKFVEIVKKSANENYPEVSHRSSRVFLDIFTDDDDFLEMY